MDETLANIFATCLQRIEAGATLDECLAAYPTARGELESLLRVATRLQALPRPALLPSAVQTAITGRVLNQLQAQQATATGALRSIQAPAGPQRLDASARLVGVLRALGYRGPLAQPWLRLGALGLALLLAVTLAAAAYGAVRAIFPPVATGPDALAAATRFELQGSVEALSEATLVIAGVTIDLGPQTVITGTPAVGALAQASGQIRDDGSLLAETVVVEGDTTGPTAAPTAEPQLIPTDAPTAEPIPAPAVPTEAPNPLPAPPVEAPAPAADPFTRLRQLLEAGQADGRAGAEGEGFLQHLAEAEAGLGQGDAKKAHDQLRDLSKKLGETARDGKIDPGFAEQAQTLIAEIEATYDLRGGSGQKDDDDDDDEGKDE